MSKLAKMMKRELVRLGTEPGWPQAFCLPDGEFYAGKINHDANYEAHFVAGVKFSGVDQKSVAPGVKGAYSIPIEYGEDTFWGWPMTMKKSRKGGHTHEFVPLSQSQLVDYCSAQGIRGIQWAMEYDNNSEFISKLRKHIAAQTTGKEPKGTTPKKRKTPGKKRRERKTPKPAVSPTKRAREELKAELREELREEFDAKLKAVQRKMEEYCQKEMIRIRDALRASLSSPYTMDSDELCNQFETSSEDEEQSEEQSEEEEPKPEKYPDVADDDNEAGKAEEERTDKENVGQGQMEVQ